MEQKMFENVYSRRQNAPCKWLMLDPLIAMLSMRPAIQKFAGNPYKDFFWSIDQN